MPIEPTREEWLEARERVSRTMPGSYDPGWADTLAEAALGPCPPEPAPPAWKGKDFVVAVCAQSPHWPGPNSYIELRTQTGRYALPQGEAEELGKALIERAQWLREHGGQS